MILSSVDENKNDHQLNEYFMSEALKQAKVALEYNEVPIGAVITLENKIIAKAYNQVEMLKDPTAHAEMIAITQAASHLSAKWLYQCRLYVTIEPCAMCAGALVLSRIKNIFYGASDSKAGACGSVLNVVFSDKLNHRIEAYGGILQESCGQLLTDFFRKKRQSNFL